MGSVYFHTYFLMLLADTWLRLGRPDEALAAIKEALRDGGWAVTFGRAAGTALAALDAAGLEITEKTK